MTNDTKDLRDLKDAQQAIIPPTLPYTFKATLSGYRKRLGVWRVVLALALTGFFFYKFGLLGWLVSIGAITIFIVGILFFTVNKSITLYENKLVYKNAWGKKRAVLYRDVEAVKVFLAYYDPSFGVSPRAIIGVKGSTPLSLNTLFWPLEECDKMLRVLTAHEASTEYYEDVVTSTTIAQQFPTYASYVERHPGRVVAIILAVLIPSLIVVAIWITLS